MSRRFYGDVVLITGASSGIGAYAARKLAENGFRVYGTSRYAQPSCSDAALPLKSTTGGFLKMIKLDVCSDDSVREAVESVIKAEGEIGVLINNAAYGIAGSVEDTSAKEAFSQFDTNFFGVLRMCRQVLPLMRAQGRGLIINVGSVAGIVSIPYQSMYSAGKSALESLTEALRIEIAPYGLKAATLEPGDTKTGFTEKREFVEAANDQSPYKSRFEKSIGRMIEDETTGPEPAAAAKAILRLISKRNPPIRVTVGFYYKLVVLAKHFLPARFMEYIVSRLY